MDPAEVLTTLGDYWEWLVAASAALSLAFRRVRKGYHVAVKFLAKPLLVEEQLGKIEKKLDCIESQLKVNAGSSLRDAVDSMDRKIHRQTEIARLVRHEEGKTTVVETDTKGGWERVDWRVCDRLDRSEGDLRGNRWLSYVHPDDQDQVERQYYGAVEHGRPYEGTFRMISGKSDPVFRIQLKMRPIPFRTNGTAGYAGIIRLTEIQ